MEGSVMQEVEVTFAYRAVSVLRDGGKITSAPWDTYGEAKSSLKRVKDVMSFTQVVSQHIEVQETYTVATVSEWETL